MNSNFSEEARTQGIPTEETQTETKPVEETKTVKKTVSKTKTTPAMNIFQKLLAVETALGLVAKNLTVGEQGKKNSYKAVSERDVIDAVKPLEAEYGIYSYPYSREVIESNLLESESVYNGNVTKKTTLMTRIKTTYRFVNVENPAEYVETTVFSEGIDAQDKGSGKAMTYADKYALMKMYKISTGDDPDAVMSEETNYSKSGSQQKSNNTGNGGSWSTQRTTTPAPAQNNAQKSAPAQTNNQSAPAQKKSGWVNSGWNKNK